MMAFLLLNRATGYRRQVTDLARVFCLCRRAAALYATAIAGIESCGCSRCHRCWQSDGGVIEFGPTIQSPFLSDLDDARRLAVARRLHLQMMDRDGSLVKIIKDIINPYRFLFEFL